MRYYISDLHFFHENMNTKMDKRGFESVEAMNEYMISQWNKKVRKNDEVTASLRLDGFELTPEDIALLKKIKSGEITSEDGRNEIFKNIKS